MVTTATPTSASQPKLPAAGGAFVSGLAILANPRTIHSSKTIVVDAQLYLGPTDQELLIGSLRYYNSTNSIFNDGPNLYVIYATFARRESTAEVLVSGNRTLSDYTFVGDIQWFIPLGPPGPHYLVPEGLPDADPNDLPTVTIDPCKRPYIYVTGVAMERSKEEATFDITVEQYVSCVKSNPSTKQAGGSRLKPTTPFFCRIPDSPKYKNWSSKPLPGNKRYVSVCGFLTGVDWLGSDTQVEQFLIDVESVIFCGHYIQPASVAASVTPQSSPVKTSGKASTALFSYSPHTLPPPFPHKRQNPDDA